MEFVADLLKLRIMTAVNSVEPPVDGGFAPADAAHRQQTGRVLKHLSLAIAEEPLATLLEPGRFGSVKYASLLTRTHLYLSRLKEPILLADIWDVDWKYVETTRYPTVTAGKYRHTLLCTGSCGDYLHDVLDAIRRALLLTRGAEAVFAAAVAARRDKAPLAEEPLSFTECTLDADRLFAHARVCLIGGRDREQGLNALLLSADLGSADAQYALALFFRQNGVRKQNDSASAAYWFAQAAAQGHEGAALQLSVYGETTRKKGEALWTPLRYHETLTQWAEGTPEERQKAGEVCLDRTDRCLAAALVLADRGLNPDAGKPACCLQAFELLKEARAWLEYARLLGRGEAETRLRDLAAASRNTVVNHLIPELMGLYRDGDAFLCRLWLAELGDVPCRADVARHFLEDMGLHREPMAGLQWLEWALEDGSVHAPGICAELGSAYVTGAHLSPEEWHEPLPPTPRDRAIGFYLLERGGCADALKKHLPAAPGELRALAGELDGFPFPFAAELAEQYRAMADASAENN